VSEYTEFYLNSKSSVVQLECLEISHSSFTQTYRLVRNAVHGVTVTHEDDTEYAYTYMPMRLELSGPRDDLDHVLRIVMGDLGEIVPIELDRVRADDAMQEMPLVMFRTYASDNLSAPLFGPLLLEVRHFTLDRNGCAFDAKAPSLNVSRTGETYSIARFPMLSGLR
jgi:hypothetical protein